MHFVRQATICFLSAILLTACAPHYMRVVDEGLQRQWLPFMEDGKTTKEDIIQNIGAPSRQFEDGKVLIYQMTYSKEQGFQVDPEKQFIYNLVLVFDEHNILQRHSLLSLRGLRP